MERADEVSFPAPPPGVAILVANTLPYLLYTRALTVGPLTGQPLDYNFDGFPQTLRVVADSMNLNDLSTSNLSFISNVVCAPQVQVTILDNLQLTSLQGLVAYFYDAAQNLLVSGNFDLLQAGLQPLGPALQCNGPTSPLTINSISVEHSDCPNNVNNPLSTVNQVCAYLNDQCEIPSKRSSAP